MPRKANKNSLPAAAKIPMIPVKNPPEDISLAGSNPDASVKFPVAVYPVKGLPAKVGVKSRKNSSQYTVNSIKAVNLM